MLLLLTFFTLVYGECTKAFGQFASDELTTGESQVGAFKSKKEQGYSVSKDLLLGREITICPIPANAKLKSHGMQKINVKEALENEGITERTIDLEQHTHRLIVGRVLLNEVEASFNMRAFHLADTSRVDGGAVYGEATVRDTHSKTLRNSHHLFHIDKLLSGICKLNQCSSDWEAVNLIMDHYRDVWIDDIKREKIGASDVKNAFKDGAAINAWVSLTSGHIEQDPLVLVDPTSIGLSHESFYTMKVEMPGLLDSISTLKFEQSKVARFYWVPEMKFGDMLVFSTCNTPHSAVKILNKSRKARQSAEMRMVLLEKKRYLKEDL